MEIEIGDLEKLEIKVGKVIDVKPFLNAKKPAYKLWIDFGESGVRKSSAQITKLYKMEELIGRKIIAVTNLPPKQIADFMSEVLVLGVETKEGVILLKLDRDISEGVKIKYL